MEVVVRVSRPSKTKVAKKSSSPQSVAKRGRRPAANGETKGLLIRVPLEDWKSLKYIHAETGMSIQEQVERALAVWFAKQGRPGSVALAERMERGR
jgi:hypothetical protein